MPTILLSYYLTILLSYYLTILLSHYLTIALAEKIPTPDLLIYLRADLDTLLNRSALRNRSYKHGMERRYIDHLRLAYEDFFTAYTASPVLIIDTNHLDIA